MEVTASFGLCRLCATLRGKDNLYEITNDNDEICQKLSQCFLMDISVADAMPKTVCHDCLGTLRTVHAFYLKVQASKLMWEQLFQKTDEDKNTVPTVLKQLHKNQNPVHEPEHAIQEQELEEGQELVEQVDMEEEQMLKEEEQEFEEDQNQERAQEHELQIEQQIVWHEKEEERGELIELEQQEEYVDVHGEIEMDLQDFEATEYVDSIKPAPLMALASNVEEKATDDPAATENDIVVDITQEESDGLEEMFEEEHTLEDDTESVDVEEEFFCEEEETEYLVELEAPQTMMEQLPQFKTWHDYPLNCCKCDFVASGLPALQIHMNQSHEIFETELHHKCNDCQKICTRYCNFINHVRQRHQNSLVLVCDICDKHLPNFKELSLHRSDCRALHKNYPELHVCPYCGKSFIREIGLKQHKSLTHVSSNGEEQRCSICTKSFKTAVNLQRHMSIHTDEKKFACTQCDKKFRLKLNLTAHMYAHKQEKKYSCVVCEKLFKTANYLEIHYKTHSDTKLFNCSYCDKSFRTKDTQLTHERVHTGEKPFECDVCSKKFRFRSTLISHKNTHSNTGAYGCRRCDKTFTNFSNYNKHLRRRHQTTAAEEKKAALEFAENNLVRVGTREDSNDFEINLNHQNLEEVEVVRM